MILPKQDRGYLIFNMGPGIDWTVPGVIVKNCDSLPLTTRGIILETITGYYVRKHQRSWGQYMKNYQALYIREEEESNLYRFDRFYRFDHPVPSVDESGYALKSDTFYYIHNLCHA